MEVAGVVELLGVVPSEGFTKGATVEEPGLQYDGVVPVVAPNTRGVSRVWLVLTDLGNTEDTHLTNLHLPAALAPDVSLWVGPARQLKPGPALVFVLSPRDPVGNRPSQGLVASGHEIQVALHLAGVGKRRQLVYQVWTVPGPSEEKVRRREGGRINGYLTLWTPRTV